LEILPDEGLSDDEPFFAAGKNPRRDDNAGGTEILAGGLFNSCLRFKNEF
jgi:hypothetical protein